jgi:hypothetical protein
MCEIDKAFKTIPLNIKDFTSPIIEEINHGCQPIGEKSISETETESENDQRRP